MKRVLLLALAAIAITTTSYAQSGNLKLRFRVPFPFTVENATFGEGEYEVTQPDRLILMLRNVQDQSSAFQHVQPPQSRKEADGRMKVVFHRYGSQYFLAAVSDGSYQATYDLRLSKEEKRLADANSTPRMRVVSVLADGTVQPASDGQQ
ncbi:MAG TPA: hypothetical protein VK466_01995 [Terriglobales bacterium]|nr:hypothetical protein [Terriglobales bacterium]